MRAQDSSPFFPRLPSPPLPANDRSSTTGVRSIARDAGRYSIVANQGEHHISEETPCVPVSPKSKNSH